MMLPAQPKFQDIPGLESIIWSMNLKNDSVALTEVGMFIGDLWISKQGTKVPKPSWMLIQTANEITSAVLEFREHLTRREGEVEIRKVAEIRGSRFNSGKPRFDLLDWDALQGTAAILEFGAKKYAPYNWKKGLPYMEILASMMRHIAAITRGEDNDPETGLPHADHIQCNAMFLSWMMKNRPDMDDRHKA